MATMLHLSSETDRDNLCAWLDRIDPDTMAIDFEDHVNPAAASEWLARQSPGNIEIPEHLVEDISLIIEDWAEVCSHHEDDEEFYTYTYEED